MFTIDCSCALRNKCFHLLARSSLATLHAVQLFQMTTELQSVFLPYMAFDAMPIILETKLITMFVVSFVVFMTIKVLPPHSVAVCDSHDNTIG
jgi:hypothetical protein